MSKELEEKRKQEIVNACRELYKTKKFEEITIKDVANLTTFSRPSIYNYFQTKEEIFLEILKEEYEIWTIEIENKIYLKNEKLTIEEFSKLLSKLIAKREVLLKLLSMNLYDIEENSTIELLAKFKETIKDNIEVISKCLDKFFRISIEKKQVFLYSFLPLLYGIYPYTNITEKQSKAMKKAGLNYKKYSIYNLTYNSICLLLKSSL